MIESCEQIGPYVVLKDDGGRRHVVRRTSVQLMSDEDELQDATLLTAAGRTLRIPLPLDVVVCAVEPPVRR